MYRSIETNLYAGGLYGYSFPRVETVIYPNTVKKIYGSNFGEDDYDNDNLKKVVLPDELKEIGNNAFYGCAELTNINIPSSVTNIGSSALYLCNKYRKFCILWV